MRNPLRSWATGLLFAALALPMRAGAAGRRTSRAARSNSPSCPRPSTRSGLAPRSSPIWSPRRAMERSRSGCSREALGRRPPGRFRLQGGTVEMTILVTSLLVGNSKDFTLLDTPFLFENEQGGRHHPGRAGRPEAPGRAARRGLVGLGYFEYGFRNFTNSRRPVRRSRISRA